MPDQALVPFQNPFTVLSSLGIDVTAGSALTALLAFVFAVWLIYTLIATYHWLKYSHASLLAFPAIFVHLAVSVALMSYALTGSIVPTFL